MSTRLISSLLLATAACAAPLDHSYFGFDDQGSGVENFTAFRNLEAYANSNGSASVVFSTNGTYAMTLPKSDEDGYRGLQQGACMLSNVTGFIVDAPGATFFCTNQNGYGQSVFQLKSCTNIDINARFMGVAPSSASIASIHLWSSNSYATCRLHATLMHDGVRVGQWDDPTNSASSIYLGNQQITIYGTNVDSEYGVAAYLTDGMTINYRSEGTEANGWGSSRCAYLTGCSNVVAHSWTKNMHVADGCNIIGSAPCADPPYHYGCSNVVLYAVDTGTTNYVASQSLAKINIVSSSAATTNIVHEAIHIDVTVPASATGFTNNSVLDFGCLGAGASHVYSNITLSGAIVRQPDNIQATIYRTGTAPSGVGLAYLGFAMEGFHDDTNYPTTYTMTCYDTNVTVRGVAYNSDVNLIYLKAGAPQQTFTDYGYLRRLRATTIRAGTLRGP